ncbi:lipocalin family protein [Cellvibrio sp. PSBB023]|uniref:lipocalin family protein n=1 Tax=Cellvibrio sp. PSBB023 TaxID=1945512 RepID=UPI00098EDA20|nr:lipocalin family protein [Cellvibrio sp. PSBB023]AQT59120.1 lipocalin [Cellvibrio sp. PSBB023]
MKIYAVLLLVGLLSACTGMPENIKPVDNFDANRYLGQWYEIARLDHSFERGLSHISATYSLREDGGIHVLNKGYSAEKKAWQSAEGKAYFVDKKDQGYLKVSFFGPFYGSYVVFELDMQDYQYSLVSGPDKSYFWLLARTPYFDKNLQADLIAKAKSLGFATEQLIFVDHNTATAPPENMP